MRVQTIRRIKFLVPPSLRKSMRRSGGALTAYVAGHIHMGVLPDFLIIGAQKCGTTSLWSYLIQHPCVYPASIKPPAPIKAVGFFDQYSNYCKGVRWYRNHFPSFSYKYYVEYVLRQDFITGEATTSYILNPHALKRIAKVIPHAKLILLLRNPVDRAYSHYHHMSKRGMEDLSFEEAIKREKERIGRAFERMQEDETAPIDDLDRYAYLTTGLYIDQIEILMSLFSREQVLILASEDLFSNPSVTFKQVLDFLNIPNWLPRDFKKFNAGEYSKMDLTLREFLIEYFKPYNQRLSNYLQRPFDWDR